MFEDFRLKVFLKVCEKGSFTLAAHELGITQPAASQNVAELERYLDANLFERRRGSVVLTDKGILFKKYAEQILHWYGAAERAFKGDARAELPVTISLSPTADAELWTSQGDIHIKVIEKPKL